MQDTVTEAKAEYTRAKQRVERALATTPDDRINWSPSSTSRTPIQQVAHVAFSVKGMQGLFNGEPFDFPGTAELDAACLAEEKEFKTREEVLALLEKNSAAYFVWLDSLSADQVASTIDLPFGSFPMASAITFAADHLRSHAAQMEYMQTIYGDREWHM